MPRRVSCFSGPAGPLGCHVGIAGGLGRAPARARALGAGALQIFTGNPRSWHAAPLLDAEIGAWRIGLQEQGIVVAVAHAGYLINLAGAHEELRRKSVEAFIDEIERCRRLGIDRLVVHPGSRGEATVGEGRRRVLRALNEAVGRTAGAEVKILLEATAGTGASLGASLEELAWLIAHVAGPERLGVCLDSCHLFAAGYPLHEPSGLPRLLDECENLFGLAKLGCWHLNDSLMDWNSRRDRHARIGQGKIGREFFRDLLHEPRLFGIPKILEVPGGDAAFASDLRFLARLAR